MKLNDGKFYRKPLKIFFGIFLAFVFAAASLPLPVFAEKKVVYRHTGSDHHQKPRIALTFDDGPHPRYTPQILDILKEYHIPATFFVVGTNARAYPKLIQRELAEGHEVGNHSDTHRHTPNLTADELREDILKCSRSIRKISGHFPLYFRPPEGICTDELLSFCDECGYTVILWNIDTRDWAHTPVSKIYQNVKQHAADGSIILMHDFIGKNSPTPTALREIIPMLLESGYEFVTVSRLLEG